MAMTTVMPRALIKNALRRAAAAFETDEDGATAIEYGLIAALIAVAIIGSMTALATSLSTTFSESEVEIRTATE